jgi:eukaryotic-like serine/threonine-protein kinase
MTADRWAQISKLLEAALSQDGERRAATIAQCPDQSLRLELEKLVREYDGLGSFLAHPPVDDAQAETRTVAPETLMPGEMLKDRYRVLRMVGRGGMGEVYEAEDLELNGCRIALKTLRAGLPSRGRSLERFKRETVLGRRVTHPNVCRVFDLERGTRGDQSEVVFLTLEFLDGETLHQRLKRAGAMDPATATPIARDMVAGLAACHKHGVIHRDFKSGNVMLVGDASGGQRAVITDFGLAHTTYLDGEEDPPATAAGGITGTPAYMAPEQKEGQPATAASDIYALGIVLCEMLTGRRPPALAKPALPKGARVDPAWEAVILKCIQPDPADRFQTAGEIAEALEKPGRRWVRPERGGRWRWAAAALLALATASIWLGYRQAHALPDQKHLAILPFRSLGRNPADQVFCEGLAETLTSKLSQLERYQKSFWVVPASESRQATDAHEAYRKLDATLVVTGSLEHLTDKTVLLVNLIDARTRRQLASREISEASVDLSGLEDEAWQRVADMLDLQLQPDQVRSVEASRARVPAAYVAYAQGVGYAQRGGLAGINNAIARFEDAIRLDPAYALARSGLGSAYALKYEFTQDPHWLDLARTNAQQAVGLAPDLAQVHLALGQIDFAKGKDEEAVHELKRALELDPDVIEAHFYLGRLHEREGKLGDAEHDFRSAVERRPEYGRTHSELGAFYFNHGRFADAEREFLEVFRLEPDRPDAMANVGAVSLAMGKFEAAQHMLENEVRIKPDDGLSYSNLGTALMYQGKYAEAVAPMEQAVKLRPAFIDCWRNLGDAYAASGQSGKAAAAYRHALELGRRQLAVNPTDGDVMASVALFEAHLSDREEALRQAAAATRVAPSNNDVLFTSALVYEILGKRPAALQALQAAYEKGYSLDDIEREPVLAALRKSSEYQAWVRKANSHR